jgi:hypothetical protein
VNSDQLKKGDIGKNEKPCPGKRMAEKSYRYLAPFGGITRIRFKGFV